MSNATVWKVILSAGLALICIVLVQTYWLTNAYNLTKRAFEEKAYMSLLNVADQMAELNQVQLSAMDVVSQIADNYFVVNIRDAIDANSLEYFLKKEFEKVSLPVDFEYGIYDCETNQMVYGNYVGTCKSRLLNRLYPLMMNLSTTSVCASPIEMGTSSKTYGYLFYSLPSYS